TAFLQLKTFTYSDYLLFHKQVFKDLNDKGIVKIRFVLIAFIR
ncbi:MAG: hypothetical protein JWR09_4530, partial [Mucilaginibacter sp.]|nr:hypothetical protein [Mucilaginibacter sp.]